MKVALLPLMILATTMGSSIASQIPPQDKNILINYFGKDWAERYMTEVLFDEP